MKNLIAVLLVLSPALIFAQEKLTDINSVARKATGLGNLAIALAISIAVVWIIVSVILYLVAAGDNTKRKEGGMRILLGVIGLFVILSIWGLVAILRNTFRTQDQIPAELKNGRLDLIPNFEGNQRRGGASESPFFNSSGVPDPWDH